VRMNAASGASRLTPTRPQAPIGEAPE
jgi:hypothetical protein